MSTDKIDAVEGVSGAGKKGIDSIGKQEFSPETIEPNKDKFDSLMIEKTETVTPIEAGKVEATQGGGLIDEVGKLNGKKENLEPNKVESLLNESKDLSTQMEDLKSKLASITNLPEGTPQGVLKNNLIHIDENLQVSLDKSGIEATGKGKSEAANPLKEFANLLTSGQANLDSLTMDIQSIQSSTSKISPGTMLALQMKMGIVQTEVELFTSLLSKSLESIKTVMNVQV